MKWVTREHPMTDRGACPWVDDQTQLRAELPVYDALYAWAQNEVRTKA